MMSEVIVSPWRQGRSVNKKERMQVAVEVLVHMQLIELGELADYAKVSRHEMSKFLSLYLQKREIERVTRARYAQYRVYYRRTSIINEEGENKE